MHLKHACGELTFVFSDPSSRYPFSSSYSSEMHARVEIIMFNLVYTKHFMMFGHLGRELRRFEY